MNNSATNNGAVIMCTGGLSVLTKATSVQMQFSIKEEE